MQCMSVSNIASTTSSPCSAAPAHAFRTPNVDERVSQGPAFGPPPFFLPIAGDFRLKTQTSFDVEGGFRIKSGGFQMQTSIYTMDLQNELHFNPVLFYNTNLDPTRRSGLETAASSIRPQRHPAPCVAASPSHKPCSARVSSPASNVPLASPLHRQRRRHLEHLAELLSCWMRPCAAGARAGWTMIRLNTQNRYRRGRNRRSETGPVRSIISSGRSRSTICSTRCTTTMRSPAPSRRSDSCLPAAWTLLSAEGRRDVLMLASGPA